MTEPMTTVLSGFCFLEAPRWHEDRIWFSDFYRYRVYSAREDGSDLREEADVPTQPSARTMALDEASGRVFLSAAQFGARPAPTKAEPHPRPAVKPRSFTILMVGQSAQH